MLKFCPKIKTLVILQDDQDEPALIGNGNEWMHKRYPTLEHFVCENVKMAEVQPLLELNPNIRTISVICAYVREHAHSLMATNIKLDELEVFVCNFDTELVHHLKALYERGFYQRLKLFLSENVLGGDLEFTPPNGLVSFYKMDSENESVELSNLTTLKDVCAAKSDQLTDLPKLAINLPNLERIQFGYASVDDILPFIRHSMNLRQITIRYLMDGTHFNRDDYVINLVKLNEERTKLLGAEKTTIYVEKEAYLETKWALKGMNYACVQLRRLEAYEWDHSFTEF